MQRKAFTLVELIVVITILSVLGTISFISLSGYAVNARDTKRLSDMKSIEKGLVFDFTKTGKYQDPENYTTIIHSGTLLTKQGIVGKDLLGKLGVGESAKDPVDEEYYIYTTDKENKKMQLLGFLETSEEDRGTIKTIYADYKDLSNRFLNLEGDELGILLDTTTYEPVNKDNTNSTNTLEIQNNPENYKAIVNYNEVYSGTKIKKILPNRDCSRLKYFYDYKESGTYTINPTGDNEFEVYCDMITDGGGWTLVYKSNLNNQTNDIENSNYGNVNDSDYSFLYSMSEIKDKDGKYEFKIVDNKNTTLQFKQKKSYIEEPSIGDEIDIIYNDGYNYSSISNYLDSNGWIYFSLGKYGKPGGMVSNCVLTLTYGQSNGNRWGCVQDKASSFGTGPWNNGNNSGQNIFIYQR